MPLSGLAKAQRAFVSIMLIRARANGVSVPVTREPTESDIAKAGRRIAKGVHPDKCGSKRRCQRLQAKKEVWDVVLAARAKAAAGTAIVTAVPGNLWAHQEKPGGRVCSVAGPTPASGPFRQCADRPTQFFA